MIKYIMEPLLDMGTQEKFQEHKGTRRHSCGFTTINFVFMNSSGIAWAS